MTTDRLIVIGKVLKPVGLRGELKIYPYTENLDVFNSFPFVSIEDERFEVTKVRNHRNLVIVSLKGVGTFDSAKSLAGKLVRTSSRFFPPKEHDEFFWFELIGLPVFDLMGVRLGEVKSLIRTPAHDVLEIQNGEKELLIPFVDEVVKSVDVEQSRIVVDTIEEINPDD